MRSPILPTKRDAIGLQKSRFRFRILPVPSLCLVAVILYFQFRHIPIRLFTPSANELKLSAHQLTVLEVGLRKCAEFDTPILHYTESDIRARANPRWNPVSGQNQAVMLKNVTLFDGDAILDGPIDVTFQNGIITSVQASSTTKSHSNAIVHDMSGKFVTPGLVDMHSHHLVGTWPALRATEDTNEVNPAYGPLTPFVRSLDGMKPYDKATTIIRSGGITTSLILPGSANVMGGEAFIVKNVLRSGKDGEESVEEMLLDHGVPKDARRRYMKMACGENPRRVYKHTRMGNAWVFRKHMESAVELKAAQEEWCLNAAVAREKGDKSWITALTRATATGKGGLPEELELESSVAILRGKVGVNIHCYEPEDFEDMILHSKEFGFRIQAFHHALSAWKVPELIKANQDNITIATFSDFALYKQEAYGASLYAGKILSEHGVPIAYKSDHGEELTNAKYLLYQAAMGHSYGLPEIKALQSVTSVPAKSLQQDHRIGYSKPGYDADLVVWTTHPLSVGATPLQVYVDGKETLDMKKAQQSMPEFKTDSTPEQDQPRVRPQIEDEKRLELCKSLGEPGSKIIITGIVKSFLSDSAKHNLASSNMTAVIAAGKVVCLGAFDSCVSAHSIDPVIRLTNGHLSPGLTAVSRSLGLREIAAEDSTGDGAIDTKMSVSDEDRVVYAKYGVHLEGKGFKRAQIGGVTRAVTMPLTRGGFMGGVSVGIKTSEKKSTLDGGIFQPEVGLHLLIGQGSKRSQDTPSISLAVSKLRQILSDNDDDDNVFTSAANGSIPLVIHADNKYDIMQMIKVKSDFPTLKLVIYGGAEAPAVASELAAAQIPVILTHNRGGPESFENKDLLVGPPLTPSAASVLVKANVTFALAMDSPEGESGIHALALEASWAAKYSGLSYRGALDLVSTNVHEILGLDIKGKEDIVVWEGNPLEFGASVVTSVDGDNGEVMACWPVSH